MTEEPPVAPPVPPPIAATSNDAAAPLAEPQANGRVVIDLTQLLPPLSPSDRCVEAAPDPVNPEIVVCTEAGPSPRLGPVVGPVDEEVFGSAIPRARIKLSDAASAEANGINQGVGGFNANGGEVRLKIDF